MRTSAEKVKKVNGAAAVPQESSDQSELPDLRVLPRTVRHQTVDKLRQAIVTGVFKPGQRLVEAKLCNLFGVSRPLIREALSSLEAERLIAIIPNRGPLVRALAWEEAAQIYQLRSLLEGEAASACARLATRNDIAAMRKALDDFKQATKRGDAGAEIAFTEAFYAVLLRACGNTLIEETLKGLTARINLLRARSMSRAGRSSSSLREMRMVLAAIENRDETGARAAAARHVERACAAAKTTYDEGGDFGRNIVNAGANPRTNDELVQSAAVRQRLPSRKPHDDRKANRAASASAKK